MAAAKFKPPRLVALIDYNKVRSTAPATIIMPWTSPRSFALQLECRTRCV